MEEGTTKAYVFLVRRTSLAARKTSLRDDTLLQQERWKYETFYKARNAPFESSAVHLALPEALHKSFAGEAPVLSVGFDRALGFDTTENMLLFA